MRQRIKKYERRKIMLWLSIILVGCLFIIIRDCDLPVVRFGGSVDIYIEKIFVHDGVDKTLYNIAISYLAAYVFYVVQVYVPMVLQHKKGMCILKKEIEKSCNYIRLLSLLILNIYEVQDDKMCVKEIPSKVYVEEKNNKQMFEFTYKETLDKLINEVCQRRQSVLGNPVFCYLDSVLCESLIKIPVVDLLAISKQVCDKLDLQNFTHIVGNVDIENIDKEIVYLGEQYGFEFETYTITTDSILIERYRSRATDLNVHTDNELARKVKI